MKHLAIFLCLMASLAIGCAKNPPVVNILRPQFLDAIKPIQIKKDAIDEATLIKFKTLNWHGLEGEGEFLNICTASSINREEHYWLTAAHCVSGIGPEGRYVGGQPIEVVELKVKEDLAVFRVLGLTARELRMQRSNPFFGQEVIVAGHPFGYPDIFVTRGYIANPKVLIDGTHYMIYDAAGAPGNSGSPVMNLNGEILSVLQIGWSRSFSPVGGGAPYENLKWFERYFTPIVSSFDTIETPIPHPEVIQ